MTVLLVLGAAVLKDGIPSHPMQRRCNRAVQYWNEGGVEQIILSGGAVTSLKPEAELMRILLLEAGVPDEIITLETASKTTMETALNVTALLGHGSRLVAVTDTSHAPRTWLSLRSYGLRPTMVTTWGYTPKNSPLACIKQIAREFLGLPYYAIRLLFKSLRAH